MVFTYTTKKARNDATICKLRALFSTLSRDRTGTSFDIGV